MVTIVGFQLARFHTHAVPYSKYSRHYESPDGALKTVQKLSVTQRTLFTLSGRPPWSRSRSALTDCRRIFKFVKTGVGNAEDVVISMSHDRGTHDSKTLFFKSSEQSNLQIFWGATITIVSVVIVDQPLHAQQPCIGLGQHQ